MQTVYVLGRPLPIASLKMLKRCTAYVCLCDVVFCLFGHHLYFKQQCF